MIPSRFKNNYLRGDFYFRDVYRRHAFSTFSRNEVSEYSTVYIDENEEAVNCTSQICTFDNGVGAFHLYTRDGQEIDKANAARATVSVSSANAIFRSATTHVDGAFAVSSLLTVDPSAVRVGINVNNPSYTLDVNGDCNIRGNIWVNGAALQTTANTDSVVYGTTVPFLYTGPGDGYTNGVPFFAQQDATGDAFVAASGPNNNVFTFTKSGTFLVQAEVEGGYPFFPEGDATTFFLKNGEEKLGVQTHAYDGAGAFGCATTYLVNATAHDSIAFIIDSVSQNAFEAGIDRCRLTVADFTQGGGGGSTIPSSVPSLTVQGNLVVGSIRSSSGNLHLESADAGSVFSSSIYNSTTAAGASVSITGTPGLLQRTTSSLRYKTAVETVRDEYSQNIYQLRPVWYRSLCDHDRKDWGWYGLIAEEVAAIDPRLCFWGPDGQVEGVMYDRIVPLMLREQEKLRARIESLEKDIVSLRGNT